VTGAEFLPEPLPLDAAAPDPEPKLPAWWNALAAWLDNLYGGFDPLKSAGYFTVLGGLDPDTVRAAFALAITDPGRSYRGLPDAGLVFDLATRDHGVPPWPGAWAVIRDVLRHHGDGMRLSPGDPGWAELEVSHPVLRQFVREQGIAQLRAAPVDHPGYGGKVLADLQQAYADLVRRWQELNRVHAAVDTMPSLRGARTAPRGLGVALQRVAGELTPGQEPTP
jgi:hypothetical protein